MNGGTMMTTDLDATENTIHWPACEDDAPEGWHWGRHVTLGWRGNGYYLIRNSDGACVIALQRPDIHEIPTESDLQEAVRPVESDD